MKPKVGISGCNITLAPTDPLGDDVHSVISPGRQETSKGTRHPADSATDFKYAMMGLQPSEFDEICKEFLASLFEIAIADKIQATRGNERAPPSQERIDHI